MDNDKRTIVLLATGGTIAGVGDEGKAFGYTPGQLSAEELSQSIGDSFHIKAIQVCNINSDDVNADVWLELSNRINAMAEDSAVAGFVVTHGTDTLEETAYFLNLTVKTDKPVVVTGAMRPSTSLVSDGPANLADAFNVVLSPKSSGRGVLVVLCGRIISARFAVKTDTSSLNAIGGGDYGLLGEILDSKVFYHCNIEKRHTTDTEFDIKDIQKLPKAGVIYFSAEADTGLLEYALLHWDAVVIAGAGMGEYSREFMELIETSQIPVVVSSRTYSGIVLPDSLLNNNTISAVDMTPQKAVMLLKLAIACGIDMSELQRLFLEY